MAFQKIANIKGPRGDEVKNPRLFGDDLLLDEVVRVGSAPVTVTRNVGSVRGRKGDSFANARVTDGDLLIDRVDSSGTWTENVGQVQGAQGLPGVNAVDNDAAVAGYISTAGASATKDALNDHLAPGMNRQARQQLADRIAAWISTETTNLRGDDVLQGTLRRMRIKKTSATANTLYELSAENEEPQATATGVALQYMARYALTYPEKAQQVRPVVDRLVRTLASMQSTDTTKAHYGGFLSEAGSPLYGSLAAGQAVRGLVLAYERYGVGQWLEVAKLGGRFLRTLINPNPVYGSLYGMNVVDDAVGAAVMSDRISNTDVISTSAYAWNLAGVHAMYELGRVTGDSSWVTDAQPVRDFMATALTGYWDFYGRKADAAAVTAGRATPVPTIESSAPHNDNAWHRRGEAMGVGTIESDSMEYALSSLHLMGYNLTALRTAYDFLASLQQGVIPSTATPEFKAAYNSTNRLISWPGYFRINDPEAGGASEAWGGYLDVQGAGELLYWKHEQYPTHYELTLPLIEAIVEPDRGALLKEDFTTLWTVEGAGVYAVQGTIPIAVAGIGLLETNPDVNLEVA